VHLHPRALRRVPHDLGAAAARADDRRDGEPVDARDDVAERVVDLRRADEPGLAEVELAPATGGVPAVGRSRTGSTSTTLAAGMVIV